jgi:predicted metal-dependent phosphoesterase TrpH
MQKLKAELHSHASEDPYDRLPYSARTLIDRLSEERFDVLALTLHGIQHYPEELIKYADKRGILLIPGVEAFIEGKHTLLYNFDFDPLKINTFDDVRRHKREDCLVIAPHPYYPGFSSLWSKLNRHRDIFDAVEYCHFYSRRVNLFNLMAIRKARKLKLPMVGTSDIHSLRQVGLTYSLIDADKTVSGVIDAVKKGRVDIVSYPLRFEAILSIVPEIMIEKTSRALHGQLKFDPKRVKL